MKNAWAWIKANAVAMLGGLAAVLLGALAWGAYERKVGKLKDNVKVERAMKNVAALEAKRDAHMAAEAELSEADAQLEAKDADLVVELAAAKKAVVEVVEVVEGRTDDEVVARFNALYRRR